MRRLQVWCPLVVAVFVVFSSALISAKTINVPGDFSTIQAALNAASDGDVIAVAAGSYFENVTVSKSVSIEGANKETTILDGSSGRRQQQPTVLIKETKSVTVKGFTIQGARRGFQVERATGVVIENNKIQRNARQGILVFERGEALIRNNEISENIPDSNGFAGRGVNVTDAQATLISNTIANNSGYGVAAFVNVKLRMENNKITGNAYVGVFLFEEVELRMNGDVIENSRAAAQSPGNPVAPGHGLLAEDFNFIVLNKVTIRGNAGDGVSLTRSNLDLNEVSVTGNTGCGVRFDQVSNLAFGTKSNFEPNPGGSLCGTLPAVAAGGKRTMTFNASAAGEIKVLASSPSNGALTLKLFAPGQTTPAAEANGPSPVALTVSVNAPTLGRWRVEVENTSQTTVPVVLSVRQPLFNGTCNQILRDFSIAVVKEPNIRDVSVEECQMMYSALKSLPLAWRGKVAQILRRAEDPEAAGRAQSAFIQIYGDQTRNFFLRVVFHETAHVVHFKLFSPQQFSDWSQLHRASGSDAENYIGVLVDEGRPYGQTNDFEDFATVTEEYIVDSIGSLTIAKERAAKGKPVLLDKFRFLAQLLRDETGGSGVYIYRSVVRPMPDGALRGVVQRAIVPLDNEGLPSILAEIEWEDF